MNGLIEIVQVEDQLAVRRGERAQVLHVRIAAQLSVEAGVGQSRQVGCHDGDCASKESERRQAHASVFDRQ